MRDASNPSGDLKPLILAVNDFYGLSAFDTYNELDRMIPVQFTELELAVRRHHPHIIVSALVSRTFDALDVSNILKSLNFSGLYRILVEEIASPNTVLTDLRNAAPGLDVDFLIIE